MSLEHRLMRRRRPFVQRCARFRGGIGAGRCGQGRERSDRPLVGVSRLSTCSRERLPCVLPEPAKGANIHAGLRGIPANPFLMGGSYGLLRERRL
jgi:hypothetical protein